ETVPIYQNGNEEVSRCLNCDNRKIVLEAKQYAVDRKAKAVNRLIEKYEINPYQKSVTFNDYEPKTELQQKAKEITMNFENIDETTLFFQGKPGLGKTHLSYCLAQKYKEREKHVLFVDMPSLMSTLRSSYNYHSKF